MTQLTDQDREALIGAYHTILSFEERHDAQCHAMNRMNELINERSPEQVKAMEVRKGLLART